MLVAGRDAKVASVYLCRPAVPLTVIHPRPTQSGGDYRQNPYHPIAVTKYVNELLRQMFSAKAMAFNTIGTALF